MIYSIRGKLLEKQKEAIIVETGGISYEIIFPASAGTRLPETDCEVTVFTQFIVREDGFLLFGFLDRSEKDFFNTLYSVPSVGPKTAHNIMNAIPIPRLVEAILREDEKCLTQVPGIGSKTAKRIILELKDKIAKIGQAAKDQPTSGAIHAGVSGALSAIAEARLALGALGFSYAEIDRMMTDLLKKHPEGSLTTEEIVRLALQKR